MRRLAWVALFVVGSPSMAPAQEPPRPTPERPRAEAQQERRAELERQVRRQFLAQTAQRLGLDAAQRDRLDVVLRRGADERRELARESRALRVELLRAVRDDTTPLTTYEGLLDRMAELRQRERALERREEAALAEFLDARQRAQFEVLRMQLNERVRGMRRGPPGERRDRPRGSGS